MKREFLLNTLTLDRFGSIIGIQASGYLTLKTGDKDYYPTRLTIDAKLSDELEAHIVRLIEEEIGGQLNAEPTHSGQVPKYDDEFADVPA